MSKLSYKQPGWLYKKQKEIFSCKTRITLTMSGNKLGKTLSHVAWINEQCMLGESGMEFSWLAPTYKTAMIAFDLLKNCITSSELYKHLEDNKLKNFSFNIAKMKILYPNGTILNFFTGENVDSIYGYESHAVVIDEASRLREEAYNAILTTMFATNGPVKLIANPTIKNNWFYKKWKEIYDLPGHSDGYSTSFKLTAFDAIEAGIMSQEVFDQAKKSYSPTIFARDFLAEVPDGEANVFVYEKIHENIKKELSDFPPIFWGVDLGFTDTLKSDYTVIIGLNSLGEIKYFERFRLTGEDLIKKIKSIIGQGSGFMDKTGGGIIVFELVKKDCKNLNAYNFSNETKIQAIETLAHYINSNLISYENIEILIEELENYEISTSSTGRVTYENGKGAEHDDTVIALALATLAYKKAGDIPPKKQITFESTSLESMNINWIGK